MPGVDPARLSLAAVAARAPIGVALFSGDLEFVYVNEALAAINGLPISAHLGRRARDVLGPDSEPWLVMLRRVFDERCVIGPVRLGGSGDETARSFEATYSPAEVDGHHFAVALVREVTSEARVQRVVETLARLTERLAGAGSVEEIGAALGETVALSFVDRISFAVLDDGAVRTVAMFGYPDELVAQRLGHRAELGGPGPVSECIASGEVVILGDEGTITAPITVDGDVAAVLHVTTTAGRRPGPDEVETTRTLASLVALAVTRRQATEQLQHDEFRRALNAMVDSVTICSAIRDDDGRLVDFRLEFVKDDARDPFGRSGAELIGQRVLECYPNWLDSGIFDRFRQVVETGEPLIEERLEYTDRDASGRVLSGTWRAQVVKFGDGFLSSSRDITEEVAAERELAAARQDRAVERASLRLLQQMAIPTSLPSVPGVDIAADFRAADTEVPLGGDWYDALVVPDRRVVFIVGDVAGHDLHAATNMIRLRNITNALAHILPTPGAVLSAVAASTVDETQLMATCLIVEYRPADGRLTMSRAGHPPPVLSTEIETGLWELPSQVPLGVDGGERYVDHALTLTGPTTLLLFSDGLVERRGESLDEGFDRLVKRIDSSHYVRQPQALCREVVASVINDPLEDDFCLMAIHIDRVAAG